MHIKNLLITGIFLFFSGCSALVDVKTVSMESEKEVRLEEEKESPVSFFGSDKFKVAFLMPNRSIGKYSITTVNSVLGYLVEKNADFELNIYKLRGHDKSSIEEKLSKIELENYDLIIAPVTRDVVSSLCEAYNNTNIFIPTVNSSMVNCQNSNIFFGGIDYFGQLETLLQSIPSQNVTVITDNSPLSTVLKSYVKQLNDTTEFITINSKREIKNILKSNKSILNGTNVILNIPLSKTGLVLSQMSYYNIRPKIILSTQINYDPYIFRLTQLRDRKNFLIANSIPNQITKYSDSISIAGSEIRYDRVNYATVAGLDYFYTDKEGGNRIFKEDMDNNQLDYKIKVVKPLIGRFK